jgi:hypothetical protein
MGKPPMGKFLLGQPPDVQPVLPFALLLVRVQPQDTLGY